MDTSLLHLDAMILDGWRGHVRRALSKAALRETAVTAHTIQHERSEYRDLQNRLRLTRDFRTMCRERIRLAETPAIAAHWPAIY